MGMTVPVAHAANFTNHGFQLFYAVFIGLACWTSFIPAGIHLWNMTIGQLQETAYRINICLIFFGLTLAPLKIAVVLKSITPHHLLGAYC